MAPFSKAVDIKEVSVLGPRSTGGSNGKTYTGNVDPEWVIGSVPNGGYVLALIMEACIRYQSNASHIDPIHVTAHYLRATAVAPFVVHVHTLKNGKGFTNLTAELTQKGVVKVMTHVIFGTNAPVLTKHLQFTLLPPSPYARRLPLYTHPCEATVIPIRHTWKFHDHIKWTNEPRFLTKNKIDSPTRANSSSVGGEGLEWGAWFEFVDEEESITNTSLTFLVDMFLNTPTLLPKSERPGLTTSWYPTMTLAMEFKAPIPQPSPLRAKRTVGLYSSGKFMNHPQGRHDIYVEVWTAPSEIGKGMPTEGWRDNQVCLAVATQMALTMSAEANERVARSETKL